MCYYSFLRWKRLTIQQKSKNLKTKVATNISKCSTYMQSFIDKIAFVMLVRKTKSVANTGFLPSIPTPSRAGDDQSPMRAAGRRSITPTDPWVSLERKVCMFSCRPCAPTERRLAAWGRIAESNSHYACEPRRWTTSDRIKHTPGDCSQKAGIQKIHHHIKQKKKASIA